MDGHIIFNDIMESRLPIFEISDHGNVVRYKIFLDGRIEGFGDQNLWTANYIRDVVRSLQAGIYQLNQNSKSLVSPSLGIGTSESASGLSHGVAE